MNAPKRIKIRLPFTVAGPFVLSDIVPIFHRWIQNHTVPGMLIHVVDYKHVENGPGILLIGHEGDLGIESRDGTWTLYYDRKQETGKTLVESIELLLNQIRVVQDALVADDALAGKIYFSKDEFEITILDRLAYPNLPETFNAVQNIVSLYLGKTFGGEPIDLTQGSADRRWPLTIRIRQASAQYNIDSHSHGESATIPV